MTCIRVPNGVICVGSASYMIEAGGNTWLFEWHSYFGPVALNKRTENSLMHSPPENSPFWTAVQLWKDQGQRTFKGKGRFLWAKWDRVECIHDFHQVWIQQRGKPIRQAYRCCKCNEEKP